MGMGMKKKVNSFHIKRIVPVQYHSLWKREEENSSCFGLIARFEKACYFQVRRTNWSIGITSKIRGSAHFLIPLTPKRHENWLLAWRVCVCVCVCVSLYGICVSVYLCVYLCICVSMPVCLRKRLSVNNILRTSWPIWRKVSVYVAIGLESRTSPSQYNRTNISP